MTLALLGLIKSGEIYGQDINIKIGFRDSIESGILHENRKILIHLPADYDTSNKSYSVLYLLDGTPDLLLETESDMIRLHDRENISDIIIVGIENTDRDRDMMPLSTKSYTVPTPGAEKFLSYIGDELIPHIEKKYRTNEQRILCGKSLSGLFTLYAFLTKPKLFDTYIGCSAGWLGDMNDYFVTLTDKAFQQPDQYKGKKVFMANSLMDEYDPDHTVHRQMLEFSEKVKTKLGDRVIYKYVTYENYGHVPYPSFYDGLKFIF
jgi:uncharacterized protein